MSIKFAILGILSWKPATGYELKKIFEDSSFMYWSGNNNQIYKALLQLEEESLVSSRVVHQESLPSKKVYTITDEGIAELRQWLLTAPETQEIKKPFLVQLAWSELLSSQEVSELLSRYEEEVKLQWFMQQEHKRRALHTPDRSSRERFLWERIADNMISTCEQELQWVRETRRMLLEREGMEEKIKMDYRIRESERGKYIELMSAAEPLRTENDALDLIALGWEHETQAVLIHGEALSEDFFKLRTKSAGDMIQKFTNYGMKVAAIIPRETTQQGRFKEMASETNNGPHFRIYDRIEEAEQWLLQ